MMPERCAPRVPVHVVLKAPSDPSLQVGLFCLVYRGFYASRNFFAQPVLSQCSVCGLLSSSSRLSPRLPLRRTTASRTATLPWTSTATSSPRAGRPRRYSRTTVRLGACGKASHTAYRTFRQSRPTLTPALRITIIGLIRTAVSCSSILRCPIGGGG